MSRFDGYRRDGQLALAGVRGVDVAYWDPMRRTGHWGDPARISRPVRNFGDLLGPVVVRALVREFGLSRAARRSRLLTVGSVLHFARPGDTVWGSGLNPKAGGESTVEGLDLRAVRGPRTAALLAGAAVPRVFGDPAMLLGAVRPGLVRPASERRRAISVVPNLNELGEFRGREHVVNPRGPLRHVIRTLADSRLVVGSSLHGIIVAEALGVPARAVLGSAESPVKYQDYYLASGRDPDAVLATDIDDAIARGGVEPPTWDPRPLLEAFPRELWVGVDASDPSPARVDDAIATMVRRFGAIVSGATTASGAPRPASGGA